jgi:murein DD-endopeptidase MepM/ murein hydrolase activator NlpD
MPRLPSQCSPRPRPLDASISSPHGDRSHPVTGEASIHHGVDYSAAWGTSVAAASWGIVIKAGPDTMSQPRR